MSSFVKYVTKASKATYLYTSTSHWVSGVGPRATRKCIGKLNPETGEIISTSRHSKKAVAELGPVEDDTPAVLKARLSAVQAKLAKAESQLHEQENVVKDLKSEVRDLKDYIRQITASFEGIERAVSKFADVCKRM